MLVCIPWYNCAVMPPEFCELCGRELEPHNHYIVRIDVFADPSMPPTSSAELEAVDFDAVIDGLLEQMKDNDRRRTSGSGSSAV